MCSDDVHRAAAAYTYFTQVSQVRNLWYKSNKEGISPPKGEL